MTMLPSDHNQRISGAVRVAPYLTHEIRHHGQVTLIPPDNAGRVRKEKEKKAKSSSNPRPRSQRAGRSNEEPRFNIGPPVRSTRRAQADRPSRVARRGSAEERPNNVAPMESDVTIPDYPPPSFAEAMASAASTSTSNLSLPPASPLPSTPTHPCPSPSSPVPPSITPQPSQSSVDSDRSQPLPVTIPPVVSRSQLDLSLPTTTPNHLRSRSQINLLGPSYPEQPDVRFSTEAEYDSGSDEASEPDVDLVSREDTGPEANEWERDRVMGFSLEERVRREKQRQVERAGTATATPAMSMRTLGASRSQLTLAPPAARSPSGDDSAENNVPASTPSSPSASAESSSSFAVTQESATSATHSDSPLKKKLHLFSGGSGSSSSKHRNPSSSPSSPTFSASQISLPLQQFLSRPGSPGNKSPTGESFISRKLFGHKGKEKEKEKAQSTEPSEALESWEILDEPEPSPILSTPISQYPPGTSYANYSVPSSTSSSSATPTAPALSSSSFSSPAFYNNLGQSSHPAGRSTVTLAPAPTPRTVSSNSNLHKRHSMLDRPVPTPPAPSSPTTPSSRRPPPPPPPPRRKPQMVPLSSSPSISTDTSNTTSSSTATSPSTAPTTAVSVSSSTDEPATPTTSTAATTPSSTPTMEQQQKQKPALPYSPSPFTRSFRNSASKLPVSSSQQAVAVTPSSQGQIQSKRSEGDVSKTDSPRSVPPPSVMEEDVKQFPGDVKVPLDQATRTTTTPAPAEAPQIQPSFPPQRSRSPSPTSPYTLATPISPSASLYSRFSPSSPTSVRSGVTYIDYRSSTPGTGNGNMTPRTSTPSTPMSVFSVDSVGGSPRFGYGYGYGYGGEMNGLGPGPGHYAIGSSPLRPRSRSVSPTKGSRGAEVDKDHDKDADGMEEKKSQTKGQVNEAEGPVAVPFPSLSVTHPHPYPHPQSRPPPQPQVQAQLSPFSLGHKHSQSFDPTLSSSSSPPVTFQKPSSIRRFSPPSSSPLAQKAISAPELSDPPAPPSPATPSENDEDEEEEDDDDGSLFSALEVPSSQLRGRTTSSSRGNRDSADTDSLIDLYDHTPSVSDTEPMPSQTQSQSEKAAGKRRGGRGEGYEAADVEDMGVHGARGVEGGGARVYHYSGRPLPLPPGASADVPQTPLVVEYFRGIGDGKERGMDDDDGVDSQGGERERKDSEEDEVDLMSLDGEEFVTASSTLREQAQAVLERVKAESTGQDGERSPFDDVEDEDEDDGGGTNSTIMATPLSTWKPLIPPPSPSPPRTPSHAQTPNYASHGFGVHTPSSPTSRPPLPPRPTLLSPQPSVSTIGSGSGAATPLPSTPGDLEGEVEELFQLHHPAHFSRPQRQDQSQSSYTESQVSSATSTTSPRVPSPSFGPRYDAHTAGANAGGGAQAQHAPPSPRPYIDYTDLDVLISRLEEGNMRAGDNYDNLLLVEDIIGPANNNNEPPRRPHSPPIGRIELIRRRVTKDGRVKLKLELLGVPVDRCAICMTQFRDGEYAGLGTGCKHAFHESCLSRWLARNRTCPVCRLPFA